MPKSESNYPDVFPCYSEVFCSLGKHWQRVDVGGVLCAICGQPAHMPLDCSNLSATTVCSGRDHQRFHLCDESAVIVIVQQLEKLF